MRCCLILLCCVSIVNAQPPFIGKDSAAVKTIPGLSAIEPFDTAHPYKKVNGPFVYLSSDNDLYNVFGYFIYTQWREFDFHKYHILGIQECKQCQRVCRHDEGEKECHRNACSREWIWLQRENEKAFTEIPSITVKGHVEAPLPVGRKSFFRDTVIRKPSDSTLVNWYTNGGGDCHARFRYAVFKDRYYPVLLLKEWNYYGGCRAGGDWDFTITFKRPEEKRVTIKNTLLVELDRN